MKSLSNALLIFLVTLFALSTTIAAQEVASPSDAETDQTDTVVYEAQ